MSPGQKTECDIPRYQSIGQMHSGSVTRGRTLPLAWEFLSPTPKTCSSQKVGDLIGVRNSQMCRTVGERGMS